MSYDNVNTGFTGERIALPVGKYGDSAKPGLEIRKYLGSRETKGGYIQHNWLVVSTDGIDGTAFFSLNHRPEWETPEAVALAFKTELPEASTEDTEFLRKLWLAQAEAAVLEANTPTDETQVATDKQYDKMLLTARIQIGTIFRLQDWAGHPRNPAAAPDSLVGTRFAGSVEPGLNEKTTSVKAVFSRKKDVK